MSVQITREQLEQQKDSLKTKLNEVQEQLDKLDVEIYGGKMKKAIILLSECLDYLNYPTVSLNYSDCAETVVEFDLDEIIAGLQVLYREEF